MSWTDDISDSDSMLPALGAGGVLVFIIICAIAFFSEKEATQSGFIATIVEIGSCHDASCAIRVKHGESVEARVTGSKVFVGDLVKCNDSRCYKD